MRISSLSEARRSPIKRTFGANLAREGRKTRNRRERRVENRGGDTPEVGYNFNDGVSARRLLRIRVARNF